MSSARRIRVADGRDFLRQRGEGREFPITFARDCKSQPVGSMLRALARSRHTRSGSANGCSCARRSRRAQRYGSPRVHEDLLERTSTSAANGSCA